MIDWKTLTINGRPMSMAEIADYQSLRLWELHCDYVSNPAKYEQQARERWYAKVRKERA